MTYRFFVNGVEKKSFTEEEKRNITDRIFGSGYVRVEKNENKIEQEK